MPVKRDDADLALTILEKLAFDSPKGKLRITILTDLSFVFRFSSWPSCHSDSQYIQLALVQCFVRHSGNTLEEPDDPFTPNEPPVPVLVRRSLVGPM